jgi:glycine/D-amino acid oxidase-like deaminating enzyme
LIVSEQPYWWDEAPPQAETHSEVPTHANVVIVGAGYTGLGAAIPLARTNRSVVVLDRGIPGIGASTRNGGITSGNIKGSYTELRELYGKARATALYAEGLAAREDLRAFIEEERIDCNYQLTGRLVGIMNPTAIDSLKRDAELMEQKIGIQSTFIAKGDLHDEINSDLYAGGILRKDIGGLHPGKLHSGMLRVAREAGARIVGDCGVLKITKNSDAFNVLTAQGIIRADHVIVATNGYTDEGLSWLRRRLVPVVSEMIATESLSASMMASLSPNGRMYGETRNLGYYFRPSPDGTRILLGGRRYNDSPQKARARLRSGLLEIFPQLSDVQVSHHWFGFVAFPMAKLPALTVDKEIIYATGFCGSGVVWARWLGMKAAASLISVDEAGTAFETKKLRAVPFYDGQPWFLPFVMAWYRLQDRLNR